ncbi:MAG: tetratricopeptide repeat protein [Desulfovibrionaceae bacterium]|nr:tetratricopeptide repeat protein [Desulfovibrionaceae bacterium]
MSVLFSGLIPYFQKRRMFALFLAAMLCLFPACGLLHEENGLAISGQEYALGPEGEIAYKFLVAQEAQDKGDLETAMNANQALLELAPAPEIYAQAVILLDQNNQPLEALRLADEGARRYPEELPLRMLWANMLYRQDKLDEALRILKECAPRYERLSTRERMALMPEITNLRQLILFLMLEGEYFKEATALAGALPEAERSPLILYYEMLGLRSQKRTAEASAKLQALLKAYPHFADAWLVLAHDQEKAGNYKKAAESYRKALENAPVAELYLHMVRCEIKAGKVSGAALRVMEDDSGAEIKLRAALLFMDDKHFLQARQILLSLENDPELSDDTALYLGIIAYDDGQDMPEALERLREIPPDAANRARMLHLKTLLHMRLDQYDDALAVASVLREDYPDEKNHWSLLAELANRRKQYKMAEEVSREGLEQWPDDISLLYSLAMSLSFQKRNPEAIPILEEILLLDENSVMVLNALGYTLAEEKHDLERALSLIRKALAQKPEDVNILDSLAWVHYQRGNYDEAWRVIKKCLNGPVEEAVIWEHYGDIALAMNKRTEAISGYTRALELMPENRTEILIKLERLNK